MTRPRFVEPTARLVLVILRERAEIAVVVVPLSPVAHCPAERIGCLQVTAVHSFVERYARAGGKLGVDG